MPHVALVTGAAGGIGAALCRALARRGARVVAAGRRQEPLKALVQELRAAGAEAWPLELDVTQAEALGPALERAQAQAGPIDWLVNNAGLARSAPLAKAGAAGDFEAHLAVNFHGPRRLVEALLPGWLERGGGRVVQVASSAALQGYAYVAAYAASKHALLGYTRSAALELAPKGVGFGTLCPHYVDSPMTDASVARIVETTGRSEEQARAALAAQNPGGRLVTPDEVAACALELLEGERSGRVLELTGGQVVEVEAGLPLQAKER